MLFDQVKWKLEEAREKKNGGNVSRVYLTSAILFAVFETLSLIVKRERGVIKIKI